MTGKTDFVLKLSLLILLCFSFNWKAEKTGEYIACFSNEFSTFSHKLVYIDFQVLRCPQSMIPKNLKSKVGDEDPLPGLEGVAQPLTQVIKNQSNENKFVNICLTPG